MDWFAPVDLYCERTSPALWGEPFNEVSNLSFLAAAVWGLFTWHRRGRSDGLSPLLATLAIAVGIGSFLFHSFANRWSELADIVPILTFVTAYAAAAILRFAGPRLYPGIAPALVAVALVTPGVWVVSSRGAAAVQAGPDPFNGSGQYFPAVVGLIVLAMVLTLRRRAVAPWVVGAAVAFSAALVFRTVDLAVCAVFPVGTHFLWHVLDGVTVALLLQGLARTKQAPS